MASHPYDIIVIGSGLGGLLSAYILTKAGYKVCILEKNRQYGGCLQIFARDKVIFDTGVHYIGGLDEGQNLYQYWNYFGLMEKLKVRKMNTSGFDKISFAGDDKLYNHANGSKGFVEALVEDFPNEREGLQKYMDSIDKICEGFSLYNVKSSNKAKAFDLKTLGINTKTFIASCTDDVKLQNVLAGSNGLYAGYGDETPLYVHALVSKAYILSAYKCVDGGGQITMHLERALRKMGCTMINYAKVVKMNFKGNEIENVELEDGRKIFGKQYISNIHPAMTMKMIEPGNIRKAYRNRMSNLPNSLSVFTLHLVFHENAFEYIDYNIYHHDESDAWEGVNYKKEDWPTTYAIFVPAESRSEKYARGMNVMSYMHYEDVEQWADTFNTIPKHKSDRNKSYQDWKIEKSEQLIDKITDRYPDIRSKIKSYYSSTPLSFRDYIGSEDGSLYGVRKDYKEPLRTYISAKTKVPNLFLTGQNLNMHGMLGVTIGAVVTCSQFLEMDKIIKDIKAAN